MKGFPALVAQAATLLVFFIASKQFTKLLSLPHIAGIAFLLMVIGTYYSFYFQQNPRVLSELFSTLWDLSVIRTSVYYPWEKILTHIVLSPLRFLYEMLPVSLLVVACLRKDFLKILQQQQVLYYMFLFMQTDSLTYWLSPYWRVRYIFMLFPMAVTLMLNYYMRMKNNQCFPGQAIHMLIICVSSFGILGVTIAPFIDRDHWPPGILFINFLLAGITTLDHPGNRLHTSLYTAN